jgi:hypothetical protein
MVLLINECSPAFEQQQSFFISLVKMLQISTTHATHVVACNVSCIFSISPLCHEIFGFYNIRERQDGVTSIL